MQDPNQSEARLRVTVLTLADKLHGSHEARLLDDPCMAATARDLILEDKILGSDSSSGPAIYGIRPAGLQELRAEKPGRRLLSGMLTLIGLVTSGTIWIFHQFISLDAVRGWLNNLVKSLIKTP